MISDLLPFDVSLSRTTAVLLAVAAVACLDLLSRLQHRREHYAFGVLFGSTCSVGLIKATETLFQGVVQDNALVVTVIVILILLLWRMLFGAWSDQVKATVLGTFIFWIAIHFLFRMSPSDRIIHLIAAAAACVPAAIWSALFLRAHWERMARVLLMFFGGMLATAPVLFYDALVRNGVEIQFFLLRIIPESFSRTTESVVSGQLFVSGSLQATLASLFVSFLFVGLIEEGSKLWVLSRAGQGMMRSIDEVMQLAIMVAIGFAFAENILNPTYFVSFVRELMQGLSGAAILTFLGNIAGRSILTSMVHIVSTGILGYFLGLAMFAGPILQDRAARGRPHRIVTALHRMLGFPERQIFRKEMIFTGLFFSLLLHGLSNFLVTFPEQIPGKPRTIGELFGLGEDHFTNAFSLLLIPSLLYVVGGFWLLMALFESKENMKERGHLVTVDTYVREN